MSTQTMTDTTRLRSALADDPDTLVVDVRTPAEFRAGHIPGAINLPLDQVDAHLRRIVADAGGHMVLVCQSGGRASRACEKLTTAGLDDVEVLEGGMTGWTAAGGPVDRVGDGAGWPIERQVRLTAGGIVFVSILASIVWPRARFVAGAVGAGLTWAGLSNSCAMGAVLARLPFNAAPTADIDDALARLSG
ncbi:MAG TPA: rhodanese-like domain-containing protein [Euzebyales bacterium]